jgi:hypothetical protein
MFALPQPNSLRQAVELGDYLRRSQLRLGEGPGHKEWLHFVVSDPGLHLLVNFNFADQRRARARGSAEEARLIVLACGRDGFAGGIVSPPWTDVDVVGGAIDARIGGSRVIWRDGVFAIELDEPDLGILGTLRIHPVTFPSIVHNFPLGPDRRMHWFTLPRSWCSGTVVIGDHVHELRGAPAYHDHNWGAFAWGGDYSWQWGFALPESLAEPWSLVFLGMHDRRGHRADVRGVFVWRQAREKRLFRDREVGLTSSGVWLPERVHKVPGVMRLLVPGTATTVPAELVVEAQSRSDHVVAVFRPREVAQVVVPNETDTGFTILNETIGHLSTSGRIDGESFAFEAETVVEFLGG